MLNISGKPKCDYLQHEHLKSYVILNTNINNYKGQTNLQSSDIFLIISEVCSVNISNCNLFA
jgi:hypothetical protein